MIRTVLCAAMLVSSALAAQANELRCAATLQGVVPERITGAVVLDDLMSASVTVLGDLPLLVFCARSDPTKIGSIQTSWYDPPMKIDQFDYQPERSVKPNAVAAIATMTGDKRDAVARLVEECLAKVRREGRTTSADAMTAMTRIACSRRPAKDGYAYSFYGNGLSAAD